MDADDLRIVEAVARIGSMNRAAANLPLGAPVMLEVIFEVNY